MFASQSALTTKQDVCDRILAFLRQEDVTPSRMILTDVDNVGACIVEGGQRRTYQSEGWLNG